MLAQIRHEQVVYQNPFLSLRIWEIDGRSHDRAPEALLLETENDRRRKHYEKWHYHKEVEFLLIFSGEMTVFCPDETFVLRAGDVAVLGSREPHTTVYTGAELRYCVLQVDLEQYWDQSTLSSMKHFAEVLRPLSALNYVYQSDAAVREETAKAIREIYREMNERQIGYELAISSRIKAMLLLLLRHDRQRHLHYDDNDLLGRMQPALDYIEENLGGKVSVAELSKRLNFSYTYFIKQFKRIIGMSFTDFVTYKRIQKAEQLLLTKDLSIAEVAEAVGMNNIGHFYRMFHRYNDCTPKQFKERLKQQIDSDALASS
ncbi:helix-turn-helix domain-containing protein [Cohnella zeiphila]|uniref:Helix-turn-helix transcriptional regulator n=1 Tax=Cohnella zeiphila TaxID=2761120 RepID=A0A7X0VYT6_9BACL|nr:AraC family transcriptional regulator [Cohnella zeiphila]MBB6735699.1 helix-turn-helix transcriptional regulator [Cohnella zeiphila]